MKCYTYKGFDNFDAARVYMLKMRDYLVRMQRTDEKNNHGITKKWTVRYETNGWINPETFEESENMPF